MRAKRHARTSCRFLICLVLGWPGLAEAAGSTAIYAFKGPPDAAYPYSPLIADAAGNFYGTTYQGGSGDCSRDGFIGCGTVFELAADGTETVLHSFQGGNDGLGSYAGVLLDKAGNLYGTTFYGGGDTSCYPIGCGTIFKLASDGTETIIHVFAGGDDGADPSAGLVADGKGNYYGTTVQGGIASCFAQLGCGVVFRLSAGGAYKTLYEFTGENGDGSNPWGMLLADGNSNFYGTTETGGGPSCQNGGFVGCGTVFRVKPDGTEKVLYTFHGGSSDGMYPLEGLIADKAGNLYGTTYEGGSTGCFENLGCGTLFRLAPDGKETVLHSFSGGDDGEFPYARLVMDKAGDLFGASFNDGAHGKGDVYEFTPKGRLIVLHAFEGKRHGDGVDPYGGLSMDAAGNLYGTTVGGGNRKCGGYGCGTVYEIER